MRQAVLQGVLACGAGQLVNEAFMRKRIWQSRHTAQPRCTQDRRHVVDGDAQIGKVIRWSRSAVTHFISACQWFDGAGQQQCQSGCPIRWIRGVKVVTAGLATAGQPALHLHQLRGAFWFPQVLLLAAELHAHRGTHRFGQQRRIGGHIVCAIAPVATSGFHAHHIHLGVAQPTQQRNVRAQGMRVLCPCPYPQLTWHVIRGHWLPVRDRA